MINRNTLAWSRLAVVVALFGGLAMIACRPAWSPDGRRLLYPALTAPKQISIGLFDRETGTATLLSRTPVHDNLAALTWTPDGRTAIVVSSADKEKSVSVAAYPVPGNGEPKIRTLACESNMPDVFVAPPVCLGSKLFLSVDGIVRLDLDSGEEQRRPAAEGRSLIVFRRGEGLGYMQMGKGTDETEWELGTVNPATLELTPLLKAPEDQGWKPLTMPAFDRELGRVAVPATRGKADSEQAVLVFRGEELETVLPMGTDGDVGIGSVHWAKDDVTLLVSLCRRGDPEPGDTRLLRETTIGGSVTRDTVIVRSPRGKEKEVLGIAFPMALSPDGRTAAFSTAMIEQIDAENHGLYLVDLDSKDRKVTRVPFPERKQ